MKGAERLRADEVVPNLDKVPPGRCRVAHGGCEMILIGMNRSFWYPSSEYLICMLRLLLTIYLASGTLQQQFLSFLFVFFFGHRTSGLSGESGKAQSEGRWLLTVGKATDLGIEHRMSGWMSRHD